jgi:hypothetical protein
MALSEEAFPPRIGERGEEIPDPATLDTYVNEAGQTVKRKEPTQEVRGQLSGIAFGDGLHLGFTSKPYSPPRVDMTRDT